jgi:hypothetical protein
MRLGAVDPVWIAASFGVWVVPARIDPLVAGGDHLAGREEFDRLLRRKLVEEVDEFLG